MKALTKIKSLAFALLGLWAGAAGAATSTAPVTLSSSAWTLVGSGPLNLAVTSNNSDAYIWLRESDAQPALGAPAQYLLNGVATSLNLRDAAPVWAIVVKAGATATLDVTTGIELPSTGGGGGAVTQSGLWTVGVSNFPSTQAITASSLPLPTGAATSANQPALNGDGGALAHVANWPSTWTLGAGSAIVGKFDIDQTTPGTTNGVVVNSSALPAGAATSANQPALNGDGGALAHVANFPATQPISAAALPLPAGAATDGTDATGATQMSGGGGIRGWLSGIYSKVAATLSVSDAQNQAFQGAVAMTVGTTYTAQRSIGVICTVAGNVTMQFADSSTLTLPVVSGWQTFPFAVTQVLSSDTTATATYYNLK